MNNLTSFKLSQISKSHGMLLFFSVKIKLVIVRFKRKNKDD
jgi:uncharacterized membrane protein